jgi:hypothetical protein
VTAHISRAVRFRFKKKVSFFPHHSTQPRLNPLTPHIGLWQGLTPAAERALLSHAADALRTQAPVAGGGARCGESQEALSGLLRRCTGRLPWEVARLCGAGTTHVFPLCGDACGCGSGEEREEAARRALAAAAAAALRSWLHEAHR